MQLGSIYLPVITACTDYPCSWLREQHAIPGAVNALFAPRLGTRIKMSRDNPLYAVTGEISTPNLSFRQNRVNPLLSSTPHRRHGFEDDSFEYEPADCVIKNPLFGSGLHLQKVHLPITTVTIGVLILPTLTR